LKWSSLTQKKGKEGEGGEKTLIRQKLYKLKGRDTRGRKTGKAENTNKGKKELVTNW